MTRLKSFMPGLFALTACGGAEPAPIALPATSNVPYKVLLQTFHDGEYADQPFRLTILADRTREPTSVLRSEQCKNVSVGQTPQVLYVFYDELMLNGFSSFQYHAGEPRIMLCDLHVPYCANVRQQLSRARATLTEVCSYRTADSA